ncbi:glycosyltransferase [Massilia sp. CCM 8695]|uniref:Glycosyltransferase n=1 Tax=Massilia frigida TaxID=2609281 RepID=A0ABX0N030_9BURK|nr:glycosyltransferase [Massilia frigida]NHZ78556.1 glycosyltransferase [Massilia frigida]
MKSVIMIGPSPASRGGMGSVVQTYLAHGYEEGGRCRFIATHVDGGALRKARRALAALLQFLALLVCGRVSLLHVHLASGVSFWRKAPFIAAARLFRRPVLLHLHGGEFIDFIDVRLSGWRQRLALDLLGSAAAAFALTEVSAAWLRTRAGLKAVELFPNPIAGAAPLARRPGRSVLFLGRLEEKKGVFDLIRAFAAVQHQAPDARLVLAGDGDADGARALAAELGVADCLRLPGWVDAEARAALMAEAAVFVLPSHKEQMPMSILEAMMASVPVVATDVGAVPHMLDQGKCGFLVQVSNIPQLTASILRILDDNILADTISERGLARVKSEYIVGTVLRRLRHRYEELAA